MGRRRTVIGAMTPPAELFVPPQPIDAETTLPFVDERAPIAIDDQTARRARVKALWMFTDRR